jgi:hypothetical protein
LRARARAILVISVGVAFCSLPPMAYERVHGSPLSTLGRSTLSPPLPAARNPPASVAKFACSLTRERPKSLRAFYGHAYEGTSVSWDFPAAAKRRLPLFAREQTNFLLLRTFGRTAAGVIN